MPNVDPTENNQVVRAFVPTGSRSTNWLATFNEMANSANPFGIVLFCGARQPAGLGGVPGVLVSVFFPQPVSPAGFVLSVTLYQQGARHVRATRPLYCRRRLLAPLS
jgi:hypothetical protein